MTPAYFPNGVPVPAFRPPLPVRSRRVFLYLRYGSGNGPRSSPPNGLDLRQRSRVPRIEKVDSPRPH